MLVWSRFASVYFTSLCLRCTVVLLEDKMTKRHKFTIKEKSNRRRVNRVGRERERETGTCWGFSIWGGTEVWGRSSVAHCLGFRFRSVVVEESNN